MSKIALYRKYRPTCFNEILSQKYVVSTLKQEVNHNNIYHAYIFSGTRGSGKTSIARIFAKCINCLEPIDGDCCNQCFNCQEIGQNHSLDIYEIDAASNSGVDEARKLIDSVSYLPSKLNKKVYIIDEAHMLSNSAWNALLKTIEEPPEHTIFIFATTEVNKIPMTIMSRCQRFDFYKLEINDLISLIDNISNKENILISNEAKIKIAQLADGSARDCLSILHQIADYSNNSISIDSINQIFGLMSLDYKIDFLNNFYNQDKITHTLLKLQEKTSNYLGLSSDLIEIVLDKLIFNKTNDVNCLKTLTLSEIHKINLSNEQLVEILNKLTNIYEKIKLYGNGLFYFQTLIFNSHPNIQTNHNEVKENTIVENKIEQPKPIFATKVILVNEPKKDSIDKTTTSTPDTKLLFKQIICNQDKTKLQEVTNWITEFKNKNELHDSKILTLINSSIKPLVSSKYGTILLFDFQNEAYEFNKLFWTKDNYLILKTNLFNNNDHVIIAGDKSTIKKWKEEFTSENKKDYIEIDLNILSNIKALTEDEKAKKILEMFSDKKG